MSRKRRRTYTYYSRFDFEPSIPIETAEGLKARSQRGQFVKNWWATRWIGAMERLVDPGRLTRGRSYARKGQVLSIDEKGKGIEAYVQGSRPKPYKVSIGLEHLDSWLWERVIDALADQALYAAQLLSGEMPADIEKVFEAAGASLFPARPGDLYTHCSCPDYANPCKHVAATHYILGERFDEDPFLLFRMRGRGQEQVLEGLRLRHAEAASEDEAMDGEQEAQLALPLEQVLSGEDGLARFWGLDLDLESISLSIRPPAVEMPALKRLGDPAFLPSDSLQALLKPAYQAITRAALEVAQGDELPSLDDEDL
jgi:uncharacterized Zn finger protein